MGYRPSRFNVVVALPRKHSTDPETFSVLNTFTMSTLDVDKEGRHFIFKGVAEDRAFSKEEQSVISELLEMGFIIPDHVDEQAEFSRWFEEKMVEHPGMEVTILTNFSCNLACPYCVQEGFHNSLFMRKETAAQVCKWMEKRIDAHQLEGLKLIFYGGEPMLNPEAMRFFSRTMWETCQARGIPFESRVITNGVLLTPEILDELHRYGLNEVKVTLDGDKETHDKKRIFKGGKGTYDLIMARLEAIAGRGVSIKIGGNFDKTNKDSLRSLLVDLKQRSFYKDINVVFFKPILSTRDSLSKDPSCGVCSFSESDLDDLMEVFQWVKEAGFATQDPMDVGPCEYYQRHNYSIDIKGKIYQCPVFVGWDKYAAGDVWNDLYDQRFHKVDPMADTACSTCAYTPLCAGGCRYGSALKADNVGQINCEKKYFNKVRQSLIWRQEA